MSTGSDTVELMILSKLFILSFLLLPFAICLAIGRRLSPGPQWKRDVGIVLTVSAAVGAIFAVMMAVVFANPDFNNHLRPESADLFRDYLFAVIWFVVWEFVGAALLLLSRKTY